MITKRNILIVLTLVGAGVGIYTIYQNRTNDGFKGFGENMFTEGGMSKVPIR